MIIPSNMVNTVLCADAYKMLPKIPNGSIDLIFTDPVYDDLEMYTWLACEGSRVLKDDRSLIVWVSNISQYAVKACMEAHLRFIAPLHYVTVAKSQRLIGYNMFVWTSTALWFSKGFRKPLTRIVDTIISHKRPSTRFNWNKNEEAYHQWLVAMTTRDEIVLDPFTGLGPCPRVCTKHGRKFLAFEKDEERAQQATRLVDEASRDLFVYYDERSLF